MDDGHHVVQNIRSYWLSFTQHVFCLAVILIFIYIENNLNACDWQLCVGMMISQSANLKEDNPLQVLCTYISFSYTSNSR